VSVREIKFRALDAASKEWVYGYYVVLDSGYELVDCIWKIGAKLATPIDYSTLGQYTGLNDKDGREIYEGDFVWDDHKEEYGQVVFEGGEYLCEWETYVDSLCNELDSIEVIGNIYEHSHLLKEND